MKLSRRLLPLAILVLTGCASTARTAGGSFAAGVHDEVAKWWETEKPAVIEKAKIEAQAVSDKGLDKAEVYLNGKLEAEIAKAQAKKDGGQPLAPYDWFLLALGASGLGATGVSMGKAALRKLIGTTFKIDPSSLPEHLQEPSKPS